MHLGGFEYGVSQNGVVVAAPHPSDVHTDDLVRRLVARYPAFGYVIAIGFRARPRINVNRPTEGAGMCRDGVSEQVTARAAAVYDEYRRLVALASGGTMRLFVKVHGNDAPHTAQRIEVATQGLDAAAAQALKAQYAQLRLALPPDSLPALDLLVEPVDLLYWQASCARQLGILSVYPRALHFEFPRVAREQPAAREAFAALLGALLTWFVDQLDAAPAASLVAP